jgi:predicted secreted Zn-dependent protease
VADLASVEWRKSTRCRDGNCVEVALLEHQVAVRDSKDKRGPMLVFSSVEWQTFLAGVRNGEFELS